MYKVFFASDNNNATKNFWQEFTRQKNICKIDNLIKNTDPFMFTGASIVSSTTISGSGSTICYTKIFI